MSDYHLITNTELATLNRLRRDTGLLTLQLIAEAVEKRPMQKPPNLTQEIVRVLDSRQC